MTTFDQLEQDLAVMEDLSLSPQEKEDLQLGRRLGVRVSYEYEPLGDLVAQRKPPVWPVVAGGAAVGAPSWKEPSITATCPDVACDLPWRSLHLMADGTVLFCCHQATLVGNLERQSLEEIWFGAEATRYREAMREGRPYGGCKTCSRMEPADR